MMPVPAFRFDDVCVHSDLDRLRAMTRLVQQKWPARRVLWAICPLASAAEKTHPGICRVHSQLLLPVSDYRRYYADIDVAGVPPLPPGVEPAAHGLVHVDHRVLPRGALEMSVLLSCALTAARVFVPPKNYHSPFMARVCRRAGIELVRWEDGWRAAEYTPGRAGGSLWYTHDCAWSSVGAFREWVDAAD